MRGVVRLVGLLPVLALAVLATRHARAEPDAPATAAPPVPQIVVEAPLPPPHAIVRFEPDTPKLTLMRVAGEGRTYHGRAGGTLTYYENHQWHHYQPICRGPCVVEMDAGDYDLALWETARNPVPTGKATLAGPLEVRGHYEDRSRRRVLGGVTGLTAVVVGLVVVFVAGYEAQGGVAEWALIGSGGGLMAAGGATGAVLALQGDRAHVEITPLSLQPRSDPAERAPHAPGARGAGVTVRF